MARILSAQGSFSGARGTVEDYSAGESKVSTATLVGYLLPSVELSGMHFVVCPCCSCRCLSFERPQRNKVALLDWDLLLS